MTKIKILPRNRGIITNTDYSYISVHKCYNICRKHEYPKNLIDATAQSAGAGEYTSKRVLWQKPVNNLMVRLQ